MSNRSELVLKTLCGVILALVVYRFGLAIVHINPLYHVTIPALPSLQSGDTKAASASGTNSAVAQVKPGTNAAQQASAGKSTNTVAHATNLVTRSTNVVQNATNLVAEDTNLPAQGANSNLTTQATNGPAQGTNTVAQSTNSPSRKTSGADPGPPGELARAGMPPGMAPGMPPGSFPGMPPGMAKPGPELPAGIQARVDRVVDSEILAPVMRPLPMALLGIAGKDVFFRAPNGQTGLIKEGDELGGVKLLRIGINRILVQEQGEQKELTIFAGLGSESLLSTQKNSPK